MVELSAPVEVHHDTSEAYDEVRRRRMLAFLVDYVVVIGLSVPAAFVIFVAGILTLGLAWLLFAVLVPLVALVYLALTLGGPGQATWGMALFSLQLRRLDNRPIDGMMAIVHGVLFWAIHVVGTPVLLVASLFSSRKRLLHDLALGTEVVRKPLVWA